MKITRWVDVDYVGKLGNSAISVLFPNLLYSIEHLPSL
ncbi:hypothetical protein SAMN03080594_102611 [Arenibacter palladensis]|uniref:Uncharacterized protein n=1 Tax=Arenibacter palladensis TaxID=237373 RepID=A0A1M4YWZ3_9FLAO|nr:hypothetical protein SAMN03080594_102611 [Arenibacter palladensis]